MLKFKIRIKDHSSLTDTNKISVKVKRTHICWKRNIKTIDISDLWDKRLHWKILTIGRNCYLANDGVKDDSVKKC